VKLLVVVLPLKPLLQYLLGLLIQLPLVAVVLEVVTLIWAHRTTQMAPIRFLQQLLLLAVVTVRLVRQVLLVWQIAVVRVVVVVHTVETTSTQ
jgi:hypothetical protein